MTTQANANGATIRTSISELTLANSEGLIDMHILIFNWRDIKHPKAGGAEIVTLEYAKGWVKAGHRVTWFTAHFEGAPQEETIEGVRIVRRVGSLTVFLAAPIYYFFHRNEFDLVIDEIHELVASKRGVQLSVALERLKNLCCQELQIIGLSATVGSPEAVAEFLVGSSNPAEIVNAESAKK